MSDDNHHSPGGQLRERLARLEMLPSEVVLIRGRVHEMATHVAILLDAAERAETVHAQMVADLRTIRDDAERREQRFIERLEQHDRRDDDRFNAVGARFNLIEHTLGIAEATANADRLRSGRVFDRRNVMQAAWIGLAATILSMLLGFFGEWLRSAFR